MTGAAQWYGGALEVNPLSADLQLSQRSPTVIVVSPDFPVHSVLMPLPRNKAGIIWSKAGILSGEYDKLPAAAKQWYLHTHGPIKR